MKTLKKLTLVCIVMSLFACNETDFVSVNEEFEKAQSSVIQNSKETFVPLEKATEVANIFFGKLAVEEGLAPFQKQNIIKSRSSAKTLDDNGNPLMYILNYEGGGFAIISATKNYYPILAYSDKGVFDLPVEIPGLLNWLNKTKDAVKMSEIFTDSIKIKMQSLWSHYEKSETASFEKIQKKQSRYTPTNGEVACWNRCDELQMKYGGEGWSFLPLDQTQSVFESAGFYNIYDDLCFGAEFNHSPLNCSVVGWKNVYETTQVGPLLSTKWHQGSPFNDLCGGKSAGCAAVAVAQVMSYYKYPMSFTLNGYTFSWNTLPDIPTSNSDHAALLKLVGEFVDTNYGALGSWTTPNNLENGIRSLGYNVTKADHNYERVERELLNYKHPVIMGGNDTNLPLPSPLDYIGQSHYWVCEGALERLTNQVLYFTEWQPNGSGTFVTGWNTINNPGILGGIHYLYFYMNWGWGGKHDGWFAFNDVNSGEGDYEHSRLDFYISKP